MVIKCTEILQTTRLTSKHLSRAFWEFFIKWGRFLPTGQLDHRTSKDEERNFIQMTSELLSCLPSLIRHVYPCDCSLTLYTWHAQLYISWLLLCTYTYLPKCHFLTLLCLTWSSEIMTLPLQTNAFCCHTCPSLVFSLSLSSPLPAMQQLVCGKFLTHYTLCNVYTPAIMEAIDGQSEEWWMRQINNSCQY